MKEIYKGELTKHDDWGAVVRDDKTLPAAGSSVLKFIKDSLNSKAGYFYSDAGEGVCYVFTDKEAYEAYIERGEGSPIATFRLPEIDEDSRYYISTNIKDSEKYKVVLASTTPKTITFTPTLRSRVDSSDIPATLYWQLAIGGFLLTGTCASGSTVITQDLSDYLHVGALSYLLTITATDTYDSTSVRIDGTITVINLSLNITEFNYQLVLQDELSISYEAYSESPVYVQFIIDNTYDENLIFYHSNSGSIRSSKQIDISNLSDGVHNIQIRAYVSGSGIDFHFSNSYYYDFIVGDPTENTGLIAREFATVATYPEYVDYTLKFTTEQYTNIDFDYAILNSRGVLSNVKFMLDDEQISSRDDVNSGVSYSFSYAPLTYGQNKQLTMLIDDVVVKTIPFDVSKSPYNVEKITEGLVFELDAKGKTNSDSDKNYWGILTPNNFHGFTFSGRKGWDSERGALSIAEGAYITIPNSLFKLLPTNLENSGRTIEITFETFNTKNESATILTCSDEENNAGLNITATSALFEGNTVGEGGAVKTKVDTKFGDGQKLNLFYVINPKSSEAEGIYPGFIFVVNNGIYGPAVDYSGDTFNNDGSITIGDPTGNCGMYLYNLKVYNRALTEDEIINNYALDTNDILNVMVRNSVFEVGSSTFSTDILEQRTPVMYITCPDILKLFADKDRDSKMMVLCDIDYVNKADESFNFSARNVGLRKQGTSTYTAPVPNLRPYLNKQPSGTNEQEYPRSVTGDRVIQNGNNFYYSFKPNAPYVDVHTLKADPAESSMTHNTGVARLWGNAFLAFNVDNYISSVNLTTEEIASINSSNATDYTGIDSGRKGLTKAQADVLRYNATHETQYPYDVRTTVDGFPIVMFYRLSETSPWVFMGQYNFNNDKSTEDVFGWFGSEPMEDSHFVNPNAECWEFRENTFAVTLFLKGTGMTSEETFYNDTFGYKAGFEARYPDGNSDPSALWRIYNWLSNVSQEDFDTQMYDYIDVWKVAAYYVYCMRFGAVDQMVKNAMFCTDDGLHWYFINYDNDTILGVRNDGALVYNYDIDRTTQDDEIGGQDAPYAFQGHDSNLWNKLTANEVFNKVVKIVDKALSANLIDYDSCIDMFNNKQAGSWCERIYNYNGRFKYLMPYMAGDTSYLKNMQGSRTSHRTWWLKNRFDIYDSLWESGNYYQRVFRFLADAPDGDAHIKVTSANSNIKSGWGIVSNPYYQYPTNIPYGQTVSFDSYSTVMPGGSGLSVSDAIVIYEAHNLLGIDLSEFSNITEIRLEYPFAGNNKLESLILTGNSRLANTLDLSAVPNLKELVLTNCSRINISNLSVLKDLAVFNAAGTTLTEFVPADGVNLTNVTLPNTITKLELNNTIISGSFVCSGTANINELTFNNVDWANDYIFVMDVLNSHTTTTLQNLALTLRGINWQLTYAQFEAFLNKYDQITDHSNVSLTGKITLSSIDQTMYDRIIDTFGESVFLTNGQLLIDCSTQTNLVNTIDGIDQGLSAILHWVYFPILDFDTRNTRYSIAGASTDVEDGEIVYITTAAKLYSVSGRIEALIDNTLTENTILTVVCTNESRNYSTNVTINRCVVPNTAYIHGTNVYSNVQVSEDLIVFYKTTRQYEFEYYFVEEVSGVLNNDNYVDVDSAFKNKPLNDALIKSVSARLELSDDPTTVIDPSIATITLDQINRKILINVLSYDTVNQYKLRLFITRSDDTVYECTWNYFLTHQTTIVFNRKIAMLRNSDNSAVIDFMYNQGWIEDTQIVYEEELNAVTDADLVQSNGFQDVFNDNTKTVDCSFLKCFTSITSIPTDCFVKHVTVGGTQLRSSDVSASSILTNVTLPNQITSIGDYAFYAVRILGNLSIPSSVTSIGRYAFYRAIGSRWHTNTANNVTGGDGLTTVGDYAFGLCFNRQNSSIILPSGIITFGNNIITPYDSTDLGSITINCNIPNRTIGNHVFQFDSPSNNRNIVFNSTQIGDYAITAQGQYITLSSNIQRLGNYWLYNSSSMWNHLTLGGDYYQLRTYLNNIRIGDSGTWNQLNLPTSLTYIGEGAFSKTSTTNIVFPSNSLTTVPLSVLSECYYLTSVTIPEQITSIEQYAFAECYKIREFVFNSTTAPIMDLTAFCGDHGYAVTSFFAGVANRWSLAHISLNDEAEDATIYSGIVDDTRNSNGVASTYDSTVQGVIKIPANSTGYTNANHTTAIDYLRDNNPSIHFGTYLLNRSLSCTDSSTQGTYDTAFVLDQTL